jgi:hypothetical protein
LNIGFAVSHVEFMWRVNAGKLSPSPAATGADDAGNVPGDTDGDGTWLAAGGGVGRGVATLGGSVPPPKWLRPPRSRPPEQPIAKTATTAHKPMRVDAAAPNRPPTTSYPL